MKKILTGICYVATVSLILTACNNGHNESKDNDKPAMDQRDESHEHHEHQNEPHEHGQSAETHGNEEHKTDSTATTTTTTTTTTTKTTDPNRPGAEQQGKGIPTNVGAGHEKKGKTSM